MIVYELRCAQGHGFEGWYASAEAYERQSAAGHIDCPSCGTRQVRKLPSAPYVHTSGSAVAEPPDAARAEHRRAVMAMKEFLRANTENVGPKFPEVARRIHYGEEAHRNIRGRATREEAEALLEEGVPAMPLPAGFNVDEVH